jgi:hypothetical protein
MDVSTQLYNLQFPMKNEDSFDSKKQVGSGVSFSTMAWPL